MARFSKKEKLIASILSTTPRLKKTVKRTYVIINSWLYRKEYKYKILNDKIAAIDIPVKNNETFGGYYDRPNISKGRIITHISKNNTAKRPCPGEEITLVIKDIDNNITDTVSSVGSYNWQQGCRPQWMTDDLIIFNNFINSRYCAQVYSVAEKKIVRQFEYPVQDSFRTEFFLAVSYRRIMRLRPDYGYRNLPPLSKNEIADTANDGIWKISYATGQSVLLHSLREITGCGQKIYLMAANMQ